MEDPNPLVCRGSNHIPGHTPGCPMFVDAQQIAPIPGDDAFVKPERVNDAVRLMIDQLAADEEPHLPESFLIRSAPLPAGLSLSLDVTISRAGRRKCPRCGRRRRLVRLSAFSAEQPVGYGSARCLDCAELRAGV